VDGRSGPAATDSWPAEAERHPKLVVAARTLKLRSARADGDGSRALHLEAQCRRGSTSSPLRTVDHSGKRIEPQRFGGSRHAETRSGGGPRSPGVRADRHDTIQQRFS